MSRTLYDDFTKDLIERLLSPLGQVVSPQRISGEARQIDLAFWPAPNLTTPPPDLGLLGQMALTPALFEPFRNAVSAEDIGDCLSKSLELRAQSRREVTRDKKPWTRDQWPFLWVITPTASPEVLAELAATMTDRWGPGIYLMPSYLHGAIVVIHQLPKTPDTMWLRLLGREKVREAALAELERMPLDSPDKIQALELLYNLKENIEANQPNPEEIDKEFTMRLAQLYEQKAAQLVRESHEQGLQQGLQQGVQQGIQQGVGQGQRMFVENFLKARFGELDRSLLDIIDPLLALPSDELMSIMLQLSALSQADLLARFDHQVD